MALTLDDTIEPGESPKKFPLVRTKDIAMATMPGGPVLEPGIWYQFGEVSELSVELGAGFEGAANDYAFEFIPAEGFEQPVITPEVTWLGDPQFPIGKTCVVCIINGKAVTGCG